MATNLIKDRSVKVNALEKLKKKFKGFTENNQY